MSHTRSEVATESGIPLYLQIFVYLQLLDFLTTAVGLKSGASEAVPFTRFLMTAGPLAGVLLSKMVALFLAGACLWLRRPHVIRWINYFYAGLVVWNLAIILALRA